MKNLHNPKNKKKIVCLRCNHAYYPGEYTICSDCIEELVQLNELINQKHHNHENNNCQNLKNKRNRQ